MRKMLISIVALLVVVMFALSACTPSQSLTQTEQPPEKAAMEQKEVAAKDSTDSLEPKEVMASKNDSMSDSEIKTDSMPAKTPGKYETYSSEMLASASGDIVLFFHASWCPSCRGLDSNIESNLANIPSGLTIFNVDYDDETELRKKYGVTTQHTLVQVDNKGTMIKKWSGGATLDKLVSQVE